jgi:hypothetical protein
MAGGTYLCFEGFEKLAHKALHSDAEDKADHDAITAALLNPAVDLVAFEQDKIRGAIRTDFILSAEIIIIALGTVQHAGLLTQSTVVAGIAVVMTVGVYGLVAAIVKIDDAGLYLVRHATTHSLGRLQRLLGNGLLHFAPALMKSLSVIGTAAMFLVGGGILLHGVPAAHDWIHHAEVASQSVAVIGGVLAACASSVFGLLTGIAAGAVALALVTGFKACRRLAVSE